jgi:hypothetical protein
MVVTFKNIPRDGASMVMDMRTCECQTWTARQRASIHTIEYMYRVLAF